MLAIFNNRSFCPFVSDPPWRRILRVIKSSFLCCPSPSLLPPIMLLPPGAVVTAIPPSSSPRQASSQSLSYTFPCSSETSTPSNGIDFRVAYSVNVMDVQLPKPANTRSYGLGPRS
jgi:hypothetical protein